MARHVYDPSCPDCTPAVINLETGCRYSKRDPLMKAVMVVWDASSFEERRAFMAVTRDKSTEPRDLAVMNPLLRRIEEVLKNPKLN